VDSKPGLNKVMLDMLERRCQGDQANGEKVSVMMDACHMLKLARNILQVNNDHLYKLCLCC